MRKLDASMKKLKKGIDDSFRITRPNGRSYVNYTCSTGKTVTVDYFALRDLMEYYTETRDKANRILVARDMLHGVFFGEEPTDKEKLIREVLRGR